LDLERYNGMSNETYMLFLPELAEFLKEKSYIYTVRGYDMTYKEIKVITVGTCIREPLGLVTISESLNPYVSFSGFQTLKDWINKIKTFIKRGKPSWLYKVTVKESQ